MSACLPAYDEIKIPFKELAPDTYETFSHKVYNQIETYFQKELPLEFVPYALHPFAVYLHEFRECARMAAVGLPAIVTRKLHRCAMVYNERAEERCDSL